MRSILVASKGAGPPAAGGAAAPGGRAIRAQSLLDGLVFSNLWVAAAAGALAAAVGRVLCGRPDPLAAALAFCGTLAVYGWDRLRDVERDRSTAPERSRFVTRHRHALTALSGAGLAGAVGLAPALGSRGLALVGAVAALALAHPFLKRIPFTKATYLTAAWLAVVVGVPALRAGGGPLAAVLGVLGPALAANAIASSVRDGEGGSARVGHRTALAVAVALAVAGCAAALAGPQAVRVLAAVPAATALAIGLFREGERYGLVVVDGALLAGAAVALVA